MKKITILDNIVIIAMFVLMAVCGIYFAIMAYGMTFITGVICGVVGLACLTGAGLSVKNIIDVLKPKK